MPSIDICGLCDIAIREGIHVPHFQRDGSVTDWSPSTYCTDCWSNWQNTCENLDGTNENGVGCMKCPDCSRVLSSDRDFTYIKTPPDLYEVTLVMDGHPDRQVMVSINTRTRNIKQMLIWSAVVHGTIDDFHLVHADEVIDRLYLRIPIHATLLVQRRRRVPPQEY
jgi:hypothetical protein